MNESQHQIVSEDEADFVEFARAGTAVKGEFLCAACGCSVTVCRDLPPCPGCGGELWERSYWKPFGAALAGMSTHRARTQSANA
jgi:hypothetical protein